MAGLDLNARRVNDAVKLVQTFVPRFRIVAKTASWLHRALGWALGKVGAGAYTTGYWTTIGYTAAYPSAHDAEFAPLSWAVVLHEGHHALSAARYGRLGFAGLYLAPQAVLLVAGLLGAFLGAWWVGLILLALGLAPLPAPWRYAEEVQAYGVELAVAEAWAHDPQLQAGMTAEMVASCTGPAYYFMMPFRGKVQRDLAAAPAETPYLQACRALASRYRVEDGLA